VLDQILHQVVALHYWKDYYEILRDIASKQMVEWTVSEIEMISA